VTALPGARPAGVPAGALDLARVRADFPILARTVHGPLVYLDNAASTRSPGG
jgi:cysteine desulfurase/selenocysteine lyase